MKYEKPQKKNPHGIIVNQHIFPVKSIERFVDNKGKVEVKLIVQNKIISLPPNDKLFCAKRCWDMRAEKGYTKTIEDSFQELASKIVYNPDTLLRETDNKIATDFYLLWTLRYERNSNPLPDARLIGNIGESLSKDDEERLEKNHAIFAKGENAFVPSRFMTGLNIQMGIDIRRSQTGKVQWGVVRSIEGEFIVPESHSNYAILPISPNIILLGNSKNILIPRSEVININQLAISHCRTYFFARRLSSCPK